MMAATVMAADIGPINNLPPCTKGCVYEGINNFRKYGCTVPSAQCFCPNKEYHQDLEQCSQKCTPAERQQMRDVGNKYCRDSGVPVKKRRSEDPDTSDDPEVEQFPIPTGIPGIPGIPSLPIPSLPLPSAQIPTWVPTAIPTAIPTVIPTAIPTAIPPWLGTPSIPSIPIPSIPTPAANENVNQAKSTPKSRVMKGKERVSS
ncbi:hypothetical protein FQN49_005777 [Arthroderma sp. PD_2]|nr:hypothetical protein FQN49_005777 [Arthroderma sp. PD_2]